ncbi:MAG: DUF2284 domain-containing protein [Muribaculaceae bacterium]|nr:DUF2284 domain-containing protein [Muribaculaceae bacterium]
MNYTVTSKEITIGADDFIRRYRDAERIEAFCRECPSFGKMWCCPPFDFDPCTVSDGFKTVKLMGTIIEFDEATRTACKTPEQASATGREAMAQVWKKLLPRMYEMERTTPGSRCFMFRCSLCPEGCTRPVGNPCRHPGKMRHSLEAVGFDVIAMARDLLSVELEWSTDGSLTKHITIVTALFF